MSFDVEFASIPFAEFDMGGVLYHANYFHLYEQAREAFLTHAKYPYSQLVADRSHLAVVETSQSFDGPVIYGGRYKLSLTTADQKRVSVKFLYQITNLETNAVIHNAHTKMVFVKMQGEKFEVEPFPEPLRNAFATIG